MEKILVTGGAGFIGSALVGKLLQNGYEVFVLDNLSFGSRLFINEIGDDHFLNIDLLDRKGIAESLLKIQPKIVIHLAAIHFIPYCNAHPFESANINITGTLNLLDACEKAKSVGKVLFASTAAVYPVCEGPIDERVKPEPVDIYGLSKHAGEKLVEEFHRRTGIASVVCRFFNAFGPNETNAHIIPEIQRQLNKGLRLLQLGNLEPKRDYIHTKDLTEAMYLLMCKFENGFDIFNLGSGREYSVIEIVQAFENKLGEKLTIEQDPLRVRKSDRLHLLADITKLKSFILWKPVVTLNAGIAKLMEKDFSVL
jgi:UDP-glucose 4-epimerase